MLIALHTRLRRRRQVAATVLVVLAIAGAGLAVHSIVMSDGMGGHAISDAATVCILLGSALALAGGAVLTARHCGQRLSWPISDTPALMRAFAPVIRAVLVRAGPPPLLQVFRL